MVISLTDFISRDNFVQFFPDGLGVFLVIKWSHCDLLSALEERGIPITPGQLESIAHSLKERINSSATLDGWFVIESNLTDVLAEVLESEPLVTFLEQQGSTLEDNTLVNYLDTLVLAYPDADDLQRIKPLLLAIPLSNSSNKLKQLAKILLKELV